MKKIFVMLLCLIPAFVIPAVLMAEEPINRDLPNGFLEGTADFRNGIWWLPFGNLEALERVEGILDDLYISEVLTRNRDFRVLPEHIEPSIRGILDRGRARGIYGPNSNFAMMIITDGEYGVLWVYWNDTTPAVIMGVGPGLHELRRYVFRLK